MTIDNKLKILFGTTSLLLLFTVIIKLNYVPGGMILSGLFLGGMLLVGILMGCLVLASILKLIFKFTSFLTLFAIITTISLLIFRYQLYSPTLKIIVPNNYVGEINLVRSNVLEMKTDLNQIILRIDFKLFPLLKAFFNLFFFSDSAYILA